jgi:hypothetical protein
MYTIYLVGMICSNPESFEWRKRVREKLNKDDYPDIRIIDPFNTAIGNAILKKSKGNEKEFQKYTIDPNAPLILPKDRNYVRLADFIFADLNIYSDEKPIIGSYFELAWAYDQPYTSVIGIYDGDPKEAFYCKHPMVNGAVDIWVKNEEEACDAFLNVKTSF